ncbi:SLC13 family permease [Nonomuraea sp. SYSU D8015]|uniref:SLC13 family permease n=1 Tax=Nonomuraea sp. SYSU D8015 TaxID=2593644 RepID=UPI001CB6FE6E|nr:SLC13 family permease [Nonomuraea sp. SYSU D8015]
MSLAAKLAPLIGGDVRDDPYTRHLYASDASMYAIEPLAVAFPRDAGDVQALVAACVELGVPVLPRGAGTSLAGQTVGAAVIVDFSRHMNRILEIDGATARVQPGVVQDQLNRAARGHGLMFGPDTSTSNRATIGGMIGNNSAGSHSVRYGSTIDHVESLRVVLADATTPDLAMDARLKPAVAEVLRGVDLTGFPRFWRHSGGYRLDRALRTFPATGGAPAGHPTGGLTGSDPPGGGPAGRPGREGPGGGPAIGYGPDDVDLTKLIVGSEGTLAVVTEATVRLVERPRAKAIAVGHFTSTLAAVAATADALAFDAASVELLDKAILDLSRQRVDYAALSGILAGDPEALLFVEFFGDTPAEVADRVGKLAATWKANGHGYHTLRAVAERDQAAVPAPDTRTTTAPDTQTTTGPGTRTTTGPDTAATTGGGLRLTPHQALTLTGIVALCLAVLVFKLDVGLTAVTVAVILSLASPKANKGAVEKVAWPTVLLICGVVTYVGVLQEIGTVDYVGTSVAAIGIPLLVALLICYVGGVVSAFASTVGILGALVPLAVPLLGTGALGPIAMIAALSVSSAILDVSPFSTTGALLVANVRGMQRDVFYRKLLAYGAVIVVAGPLAAWGVLVAPGWLG